MLRAVIFDMDGVILDSQPYHFAVEDKMCQEMGIDVSTEESNSFVGMAGDRVWGYLKNKFGLSQSIQELMAYENKARIAYFSSLGNLYPIPGVVGFMKELRQQGIKIALASSSSAEVIDIFISKMGIRDFFQKIISGDAVEKGKPDPDIFLHAAAALGENPADCIVIEDSANGVKAAKLAGMKCIGFRNLNSGDQDLSRADVVIDDFTKLSVLIITSLCKL
jgi:HAD superfamily hydrolase (TIGR01509 family)